MFGAILKATNSSFQKGMTFCRALYVKKCMKLLAFIFEQSRINKNKILSGGGKILIGGAKCGQRGREVGAEGEGSRDKGGGKWG